MRLSARDGALLAADLFVPAGEPLAAVLIAGALGVRRGYYAPFAAYLAAHGLAALTLDYRGVGDSAFDGEAHLADWAEADLAGAGDYLLARFPRCRLLDVGHSVGGQLLGLIHDLPIARAVLVASQSGSAEHWTGLGRVAMQALWYVGVPLLTATTGTLPMHLLGGGGADVPAGVANDWAEWGRAPGYVAHHLRTAHRRDTFAYRGPLLSVAFSDDAYAPVPAVRALLELYRDARTELRVVSPEELGVDAIGHFGAFRARFRDSLWASAVAFLLWGDYHARDRVDANSGAPS